MRDNALIRGTLPMAARPLRPLTLRLRLPPEWERLCVIAACIGGACVYALLCALCGVSPL